MIDRISEIHDSLTELRQGTGVERGTLLAAFGWWTRIVRTARAIGLLHEAGLAHEAAPLVRALVHHAVALKWLIEFPDEALPALVWEHMLQGNRMLNKALDRAWDLDPDQAPKRPTGPVPSGYKYLTDTEALCDHVDMANAYVPFLLESKFTHPTGISADAYVTEVEGEERLIRDPEAATPLRAAAMFAADSTADFSRLADLTDIEREANQLRDSLLPTDGTDASDGSTGK